MTARRSGIQNSGTPRATRLADFLGLPEPDTPAQADVPDPGSSPGPDGTGGRCAQPAPRRGGRSQEAGVPRPAPPPHAFRPAGGAGAETEGELHGLAAAARALNLARGTFTDWVEAGLIPPPTHEPQSDGRRGLAYTAEEVGIIRDGLVRYDILTTDRRGNLRKTRIPPASTDVTRWLVNAFNECYARQAPGNPALIQESGGVRAIELPEVPVAIMPDGSQVLRQQPGPLGESSGPLRHPVDIRKWASVGRSRPLPSVMQKNRDPRRVSPHYRRGR